MMKVLGFCLAVSLLWLTACEQPKRNASLSRLHIYAGYVDGMDAAGYRHAVAALCGEMTKQPALFSGTEISVIRFGDRNTVQAAPVLKVQLPVWPDCEKGGGLFKTGKSKRAQQCGEKRTQAETALVEHVGKIQAALEAEPLRPECVSYANLLTRLRFEPNRPPSLVITDASHACEEAKEKLEPLAAGNAPLVVIQIATAENFAVRSEFIQRLLRPQQIIPGTSAASAVFAFRNDQQQIAQH